MSALTEQIAMLEKAGFTDAAKILRTQSRLITEQLRANQELQAHVLELQSVLTDAEALCQKQADELITLRGLLELDE